MERFYDDITVSVKAFLREDKTRKCFESWQKFYPGIKFVIIDDGYPNEEQDRFYNKIKEDGHIVVRTEFDIGASAGRNMGIELSKTKYVLQIDNDHLAMEGTNLHYMKKLLDLKDNISIVGGRIWEDEEEVNPYPRYDGYISIDTMPNCKRSLLYSWLDYENCVWSKVEDVKYRLVDITHVFFLMRRNIYPTLKWDENIKICGEHTDFFLEAKAKCYNVAFAPDSTVHHFYQTDLDLPEYNNYRYRNWNLNLLGKKWGLDMSIDFYGKIHVYDYNKD